MNAATLPSFRKCVRGLPSPRLEAVAAAIQAACDAYGHPHRHAGIGLRRIGDCMECRDTRDLRLIFQCDRDSLVFHFYGTHEQVRSFLKNRR